MTPQELKAWRKAQGWTLNEAAARLDISLSAYHQYETGRHKGSGTPVRIPGHIGLACAALAARESGAPPRTGALPAAV